MSILEFWYFTSILLKFVSSPTENWYIFCTFRKSVEIFGNDVTNDCLSNFLQNFSQKTFYDFYRLKLLDLTFLMEFNLQN